MRTIQCTYRIGVLIVMLLNINQSMAFSPPSPPLASLPTEGTPYHNPKLYKAYEESMHEVLDSFRVMQKKDQLEDLEAAKRYLFSPRRFIDITPAPSDNHDFKEYMKEQRDTFLQKTELNQNQKQLAVRALNYIGDHCAKKRTSAPLHVAWDKIKEAGLAPRENSLSAYLYILSFMPMLDDDCMVQESTDLYHASDVSSEVAFYHDMLYRPTENTVSIRIKTLVEQGNAEEAEKLLWNLSSSSTEPEPEPEKGDKKKAEGNDIGLLRLRTCVPVLQYYCEKGNVSCALKLYQNMRKAPSVHFEVDTYSLILSSLARRGYFRSDSEAVEGVEEFGYAKGRGAALFDAIATEMADDVVEITAVNAKEIRNGFVAGFSGSELIRNLSQVPYDCDLASVAGEASEDELVANRVTIEPKSTLCPRTKAQLRLILLEDSQRSKVLDMLLDMADTQFEAYENKLQQKGNKSSKANPPEENYAGKHLEGFANWLDNREGKPFTAIVDGANVAYYGIGYINYHQIKLMVNALEKMGETPLVVMPQKYAQKKFYLRQDYVQELPQAQMDILEELECSEKLYKVPHRCLDDYYWMLSSVSNQTTSRNGAILDVAPDNEEGRWPGTRPMLLTNDLMRDHRLELLEPRLFRRWVSSHIVNYHIPPFLNDVSEERDITFTTADFTSREIQGNPSNVDGNNDHGATSWHFPVRDWDKSDRFCIRIPKI